MSDTLTYGYYLRSDSENPIGQFFLGTDVYIGEQLNNNLFGFGLKKDIQSDSKDTYMFMLLQPQMRMGGNFEEKYNLTAFSENAAVKNSKDKPLISLNNIDQKISEDDYFLSSCTEELKKN